MSESNNHQLFGQFKPSTQADWEEQVAKDLKSDDWKTKLNWRSPEGFDVPPFLSSAQPTFSSLADNALLNTEMPALGARHWFNVQKIKVENEKEANTSALKALNSGADGLLFKTSNSVSVNLEILLKDILPQFCWIGFEFENTQSSIRKDYLAYLKNLNIDLSQVNGAFLNDAFSVLGQTGTEIGSTFWNETVDSIHQSSNTLPVLCIDARLFHNAGGNAVQELALSLSVATEYIHGLTEKGINPEKAIKSLTLSIATGGSYFMEIAKIRALRVLFKQLASAYGLNEYQTSDLKVHSSSSTWNKTFLEPYTNMLRNTTEAMSSILGGCNSLCIDTFDENFRKPDNNAQRWSRNISTILKEESYFDKVADPAAGSYYIAQLTDSLIQHAWKLFQELESDGGYIKAFESGKIKALLEKTRTEKLKRINTRKQILVGGNQFSFGMEEPKTSIKTSADPNLILSHRALQDFEQIRFKTQRYIKEHGESKTPSAFVIALSISAMAQARKDFSTGFFQTGGFKIFDAVAGQSNQLAVICGSDDDYLALNSDHLTELKKKFPHKIWVLAGQPTNKEMLAQSGIDHFIFMNADVPAILETIQNQIF